MSDLTDLTVERLENLERANQVRTRRADDKKLIKRGSLSAAIVLRNPPDHWKSARVVDLLICEKRIGRKKAQSWCVYSRVPLTMKIEDLTERQRLSLAGHVDQWTGRRDELRRTLDDVA